MPGTDGFEVLRRLRQRGIDVPVIVYTGTGSYDRCVQAVRLGAYGFIDKAEPIERLVQEIENAVARGRMVSELRTLRSRFDGDTPLIGDSAAMRALRDGIARVAPIPSSVLIIGESGTGKELVARELHRLGPGYNNPLIALKSAAVPEQHVAS
jgi:two-component system C4-dicarboxylate transport response regulator DctD